MVNKQKKKVFSILHLYIDNKNQNLPDVVLIIFNYKPNLTTRQVTKNITDTLEMITDHIRGTDIYWRQIRSIVLGQ